MDTENLSKETYSAVITQAERFDNELASEFDGICGKSKDEYEFLEKSTKFIEKLKKADSDFINDMFSVKSPDEQKLKKTLNQIHENIEQVRKIPLSKRHFDY